jgi:Arc/MetJ-type ribon-helix-helix transcriptional regulator
MKTLQIQVPDQLAVEIDSIVRSGLFESADEVVRQAVREYVRASRYRLLEQQQLEDIAWVLREKPAQ